jgi:predicted RNase H-like nuclease (RuvC/YqgF family)
VLGLAIDVQETNDKCNLKIVRAVVRAVQSKDEQLAAKDKEITRTAAEIVSLNAALAARDREIERLTTRISGRHARVRLWRACTLKDMCASVHMSACY